MQILHDIGTSLELREGPQQDLPRWRYVYGGKPKPFFHPLCTPSGHCLTLFEPHDHVWHRGLWFTIKFVNGENFWEENAPFGTQVTPTPPTISHDAGTIAVASALRWERPHGAGAVFAEHRRFVYFPLASDAYALDFETVLTAQADLRLDRTPYNGSWGGYGGLTFRGNRNWQQPRLRFSDGTTSDRPLGTTARWADLSGVLDGGQDASGGIALFDHPDNPRAPTPWYGGTGPGHYLNAAFLFHDPLDLAAGDTLHFRYRVIVHDEIWEHDRLSGEYAKYTMPGENGYTL